MLRSYAPDLAYAARMIESFRRFNTDSLSLFCVVPAEDLAAFQHLEGPDVIVMSDSSLAELFVKQEVRGIQPGYINQEIVKLAFWETGLVDNYFCIDSDAIFLRPFGYADFMTLDGVPYTVLVEDHDLAVDPRYFTEHWTTRQESVRRIHDMVAVDDPVLRTCHGHQILSGKVLRSFRDEFLEPRNWTYADALIFEPLEFTWYNMWLQKTKAIPIHVREPLVKVFHHEGHHIEAILRGVSLSDLARGYVALVVNSNFDRTLQGATGARPTLAKPDSLSPYLSYQEVARLFAAKLRASSRRFFAR